MFDINYLPEAGEKSFLKDADGGLNTVNSSLKCEMITTSQNFYKVPASNYLAYRVKKIRNALTRSFLHDQSYSKDFYAESYVWGDPAAICDIEINEVVGKMGANLWLHYTAFERIPSSASYGLMRFALIKAISTRTCGKYSRWRRYTLELEQQSPGSDHLLKMH